MELCRSACSSALSLWLAAVFSAQTAQSIRKMLQMAAGPGGTGQKAQTVGYSVGGNRVQPTSRWAKATPATAIAPGSRAWHPDWPRIAVGVMLDEPSNGQRKRNRAADLAHFGSDTDMGAKPQIVIEAAEESF